MARLITIVAAIGALIVAIYTVKTYNITTIERLFINELQNEKEYLKEQIKELKIKRIDIETTIKDYDKKLSEVVSTIEEKNHEIEKLNGERKKLEIEFIENIAKKDLIEKNSKMALFSAFTDNFYSKVRFIEASRVILIEAKYNKNIIPLIIPYSYELGFTKKSWEDSLIYAKFRFKEFSGREMNIDFWKGNITPQALIKDSVDMIAGWSDFSKEFSQELDSNINYYIKENHELLNIDLKFNFTGFDMKAEDANAELSRLKSIFFTKTYVGDREFRGRVYAEMHKLLSFLNHKMFKQKLDRISF